MLAQSMQKPFNDANYYANIKFDGTRCIAFINKPANSTRLQNRRFNEITDRYPDLPLHKLLRTRSAVIDGELVVLEKGVPNFGKLQQREQNQNAFKISILAERVPATFVAFDILEINGKSVMQKPLTERLELLRETIATASNMIFADYLEATDAKKFFKNALAKGFEGIMLKRKNSKYEMGERSESWFKIKRRGELDVAIVGWIESDKMPGAFRSLVCAGFEKGGGMHYFGNVGGGFNTREYKQIVNSLAKLETKKPPLADKVGPSYWKVHWVKPEIVARVEFHELNPDGKFRAPRFKGLRPDKPAKDCTWPQ
jgi:bifunctional non-homologous end joining protein LigD